jgi:hypothetical protein
MWPDEAPIGLSSRWSRRGRTRLRYSWGAWTRKERKKCVSGSVGCGVVDWVAKDRFAKERSQGAICEEDVGSGSRKSATGEENDGDGDGDELIVEKALLLICSRISKAALHADRE